MDHVVDSRLCTCKSHPKSRCVVHHYWLPVKRAEMDNESLKQQDTANEAEIDMDVEAGDQFDIDGGSSE